MSYFAFPRAETSKEKDGYAFAQEGMTLRDYFAAHSDIPWNTALDSLSIKSPGRLGKFTIDEVINYRAKMRFAEADAMLKESQKGKQHA